MEFVKFEDVRRMLDYAWDGMEMERLFQKLKVYKAEYRPHMPIRIRDYTGDEPVEYDCGEDLEHHRLVIGAGGELGFYNPQKQAFSCNLNYAGATHECCFIPTHSTEREFGRFSREEQYIMPERLLVLKEVEDETV